MISRQAAKNAKKKKRIQNLQTFQIYKNLAWLNDLPHAEAQTVFLDCCGSQEWARRMVEKRPFPMLENLYNAAEKTWFSLSPAEWLEAFAAHPKIGSKKSTRVRQVRSTAWSVGEQSGMDAAETDVRERLAEANRLYEEKFGFIFIVCASGKSADEMLAIARARLGNSLETELVISAEEQRKITEIRLNKLLEQ